MMHTVVHAFLHHRFVLSDRRGCDCNRSQSRQNVGKVLHFSLLEVNLTSNEHKRDQSVPMASGEEL